MNILLAMDCDDVEVAVFNGSRSLEEATACVLAERLKYTQAEVGVFVWRGQYEEVPV